MSEISVRVPVEAGGFLPYPGGSDRWNLIRDNNAVNEDASVIVPDGQLWFIERVIWYVRGPGGLRATYYGPLPTLATGIRLVHKFADGGEEDLTSDVMVKSAGDLSSHCFDVAPLEFGTGDNSLAARWTFGKRGAPLVMRAGDSLVAELRDDFHTLTQHTLKADGFRY